MKTLHLSIKRFIKWFIEKEIIRGLFLAAGIMD